MRLSSQRQLILKYWPSKQLLLFCAERFWFIIKINMPIKLIKLFIIDIMNFQVHFLFWIQNFSLIFFVLPWTLIVVDQNSVNFISVQWIILEEVAEKEIKFTLYLSDLSWVSVLINVWLSIQQKDFESTLNFFKIL